MQQLDISILMTGTLPMPTRAPKYIVDDNYNMNNAALRTRLRKDPIIVPIYITYLAYIMMKRLLVSLKDNSLPLKYPHSRNLL